MTSPAPLPSRFIGVAERIPASLSLLAGPETGMVSLPVRLAWSGPSDFDVTDPGQRLTLYCIMLDCGQRDDIVRYVNAGLLRREWPRIRRLTSRRMIAIWERILPDLATAH